MDVLRALQTIQNRLLTPASAASTKQVSVPQEVAQPAPAATPAVDLDTFISAKPPANLGVYLRQSQSENIPRWEVLTALRAYGLNVNKAELEPALPTFEAPQPAPAPSAPVVQQAAVEAPPPAVKVQVATANVKAATSVSSQPAETRAAAVVDVVDALV